MTDREKDLSREKNPVVPETEGGTTAEQDFGKTDRYANKDGGKDSNFRVMGDETAWDTGLEGSVGHGSGVETDTRLPDAETPGVRTKPASPPIEPEKQ